MGGSIYYSPGVRKNLYLTRAMNGEQGTEDVGDRDQEKVDMDPFSNARSEE